MRMARRSSAWRRWKKGLAATAGRVSNLGSAADDQAGGVMGREQGSGRPFCGVLGSCWLAPDRFLRSQVARKLFGMVMDVAMTDSLALSFLLSFLLNKILQFSDIAVRNVMQGM